MSMEKKLHETTFVEGNTKTLIDLLIKNAIAELTTYHYYTIFSNLAETDSKRLKSIVDTAKETNRNYFKALVSRVNELGGEIGNMIEFHRILSQPTVYLLDHSISIEQKITFLTEAEKCTMRGYTEISDLTFGNDHETHQLALTNLAEKIQRVAVFSKLVSNQTSKNFQRRENHSRSLQKSDQLKAAAFL